MKQDVQDHLARAEELLRAAQDLARLGYPSDSISRSYYELVHAATAVLLELGIQRSSHHAVWAAFGQFITAPGLLEARYHHAAIRLFADRSRAEYRAKPGGTREDAERDLAVAHEFVAACRSLLEQRGPQGGTR
ncbi:MAG TPA: HEPN domain-containing protein [Planctomycetota bacterium]|nr:HEPN domain-containing protein [Planctomycetota bacterium]HRR79239.1 HEPN domain-containing protein [Planctomycetota bacterium]HRT96328.1 HEPN domain-containing protein [Planctomycetota bacterium]